MATDPRDSWNDLITRGVDLGAGLLRFYGATVRDVATRKISYGDLARRATDLARHEGDAYARALTHAGLDYWSRVLDMSREVTDRVAHEDGRAASARPAEPTGRARLDFQGKAGEVVTRAFVVENYQSEPVSVSFEASPFVDPDSGVGHPLPLTVEPDQFVLEPGRQQVITSHLSLPTDLAPGQRLDAVLRVVGVPDLELAVTATVG